VRLDALAAGASPGSRREELYRTHYPAALERAGLEAIELVDKFPVLTGNFGYTRGGSDPGHSRLVPFRNRRGEYVVHADVGDTEALFVRLEPQRVAQWLRDRGHPIDDWRDATTARLAILRATGLPVPPPGSSARHPAVDVLTLVHSYSHRFMRIAATHAGIERNSLAELIVPLHLGFFVYAAARGDFVLGGLQAVFETELDRLLIEVVNGDQRCPLDPGCQRAGGACMACLHVGEPSCRLFNQSLNRTTLLGIDGYLRRATPEARAV
jgi:hypothetical protein